MMSERQGYKSIIKATSLFGGVQVFNIIIALVRTKFIALFIGPTGMGISSLLVATINLMGALTNLGLDRSGVKEIASSTSGHDTATRQETLSVLHTLFWLTSVVGMILLFAMAPWISLWVFEDAGYTNAVRAVALALFFRQLTQGKLTQLQGLRKLGGLAKANLWGNLIALVLTVPLYYLYALDAIVPAIVIGSVLSFIVTAYIAKKESLSVSLMGINEAWQKGQPMIRLGVMLSLSSLITLVVGYMIQLFISGQGGLDQVGLYNAGFVILNTYVGLVFTAMGTDYFPRLTEVVDQLEKARSTVTAQAFVAMVLILPIIVVFLSLAPWIIEVLYTQEFLAIVPMVTWGILGMLFKAVSFSLGYVLIAKGDSKLFIKTAVGFNAVLLTFNILGYHYGGLEGLGMSFLAYYVIHLVAISIIVKKRYQLHLPKAFFGLFLLGLLCCVAAFGVTFMTAGWGQISLKVLIIVITCLFSLYHLDQKLGLKDLLSKRMDRNNGNN